MGMMPMGMMGMPPMGMMPRPPMMMPPGMPGMPGSLGITLVLECLIGIEGSLKPHGCLTKLHVDFLTVLGHLGLNIVELSGSLSDHRLNLVVGPGTGGLGLSSELSRKL